MNNKKHRDSASTENGSSVELKSKPDQDGSKKSRSSTGSQMNSGLQQQIITELKHAYEMELETVINYLANSIHMDGLLAQEIRETLKQDIGEELGHATQLAERLKILHSDIPGSLSLNFEQKQLQPPADTTDLLSVINGVIAGEKAAIAQYEKIIDLADDADDYVTEDVAIQILGQEQQHLREFEGFLRAYEVRGKK